MITPPNPNGQTPQNLSLDEINENLNLVVELLEQLPGKLRQLSDTQKQLLTNQSHANQAQSRSLHKMEILSQKLTHLSQQNDLAQLQKDCKDCKQSLTSLSKQTKEQHEVILSIRREMNHMAEWSQQFYALESWKLVILGGICGMVIILAGLIWRQGQTIDDLWTITDRTNKTVNTTELRIQRMEER
jgi:chromosome segregation ATPase